MAERLRRWTRNPLGSARAGSNPADYVFDPFFTSTDLIFFPFFSLLNLTNMHTVLKSVYVETSVVYYCKTWTQSKLSRFCSEKCG